jgi:hypothetical protein
MSVDPKKFGITPSLVDAVKLTLEGKSLAALAPPRDKVTHKDVLVGRGVLKKHPQDPDKHVVAKEEAEQVDELSKGTLGSYVKKASGRVADKSRHAGDIENRRDISPAAKEILAKQNRKIGNSLKGISRATDRLTKEDVEQVDELSKGTLGSYIKKASDDARARARIAGTAGPGTKRGKELDDKSRDRLRHVGRAVGKLTKEDVDKDVEKVNRATGAAAAAAIRSADPVISRMKDKNPAMHNALTKTTNPGNPFTGSRYGDKGVAEANGSSNPSTSSSALDKINSIASDMKKMTSEPLKPPKDPGAVKKLPNVNAPGAPDMFKTEAVADPMAAKKAEVQKKIAQKQATAVQARANKRMSNINASNDKCSCGSTNESKMKCEVHGDSGMKGGKEKIEVNPPLREAEDLPKKVITKGHEIAKSLIKNRAKVREPYAVGMAQAKKSAGIKN